MSKCLKCENKIPNSFFVNLKIKDIKMGRINCPNCNETNFLDKRSILDFSVVSYTPLVVAIALLNPETLIIGYVLSIVLSYFISRQLKGWFIKLSDKSPFSKGSQKI